MFDRFFAICLFLTIPTAAIGATIEVISVDATEYQLVTVTGPFELDDIANFKTKTSLLTKAIVSFVSDGGNLKAGIEIGQEIRMKGFASAVPNAARCASACALAWLGGTTRFMGNSARIGFHSSSLPRNGQADEAPIGDIGNALMGAYLNRIGLPDRAVIYITQATPDAMTWLSLSDAQEQGINVALLPSAAEAAASNARTLPDTKPLPAWARTPPKPKASLKPAITAEEARLADQLARNFDKDMQGGMIRLSDSITECYVQAVASKSEVKAKYCIAFDILATSEHLKLVAAGDDYMGSVRKNIAIHSDKLNTEYNLYDIIPRSMLIANRAKTRLYEIMHLKPSP